MSTDQTPLDRQDQDEYGRKGGVGAKLRGLLLAIALFPLLAALILNAQGDFDPFGTWIQPLVLALGAGFVLVTWAVTGKKQR